MFFETVFGLFFVYQLVKFLSIYIVLFSDCVVIES